MAGDRLAPQFPQVVNIDSDDEILANLYFPGINANALEDEDDATIRAESLTPRQNTDGEGNPETTRTDNDLTAVEDDSDLATIKGDGDPATVEDDGDSATVEDDGDSATAEGERDTVTVEDTDDLETVGDYYCFDSQGAIGYLETLDNEDEPETVEEFKEELTYWLHQMMYVSGETAEASPETTGMIEEIVQAQVHEMVRPTTAEPNFVGPC